MEDLHWSEEKKRLFQLSNNSIVSASAGTGKTTALTELIVRWIEQKPDERSLQDLVAITFTEKAAGEMKQRIRDFILDRLDRGRNISLWERVRRSLPAAYIGTIHAFCSRILRENAVRFDLDPEFSVLQQRDASRHFSRIVNEHIAESVRRQEPGARELLRNFGFQEKRSTDHDLQGVMETLLNQCRNHGIQPEEVRERMTSFIEQIPEQINQRVQKCVRAIDEIVQIPIDDSSRTGERLKTFRSIAGDLKNWLKSLDRDTDVVEFTEWRTRAKSVLKGNVTKELSQAREPLRKYLGHPKKNHDATSRGELQKMITLLNAEPLHDALLDHLIQINNRYRSFKQQQGYLDFDDLLFTVRDGLRDNHSLRKQYKSSFDLLLIDEFQDVNRLQYELLFYLSEQRTTESEVSEDEPFHEQIELEPGTFVVVGDPKQSIYMFRGADVALFRQTLDNVQKRGGNTFSFQENFRSVPGLIDFFNVFSKHIFTSEEEGFYVSYDSKDNLIPTREAEGSDESSTPRVELLSPPELCGSSDRMREREGNTIAERIQQIIRGDTEITVEGEQGERRTPDPGDVGVLFRSMSHIHHYERAFRERDIPYQLFRGQDFFSKPEIRDVSNLFSYLMNPDRAIPLLGYLKSPMVGAVDDSLVTLKSIAEDRFDGDVTETFWNARPDSFPTGEEPKITRAREQLQQFLKLRDRVPPSELVRIVRRETDLDAVWMNNARGRQAIANLDKLESLLRDQESNGMRFPDAARYLERSVREEAVEEEAPVSGNDGDQVQLLTVHSAKGLEFPIVLIADMGSVKPRVHSSHLFDPDQGIGVRWRDPETDIPHRTWSYHQIRERRKNKEQAESRRLLYVAMTRARDYLILSGWYPEGGWGHPRKKGTWWKFVEEVYESGTESPFMEDLDELDGSCLQTIDNDEQTVPVRLHRMASFSEPDGSSVPTDTPSVHVSDPFERSDTTDLSLSYERSGKRLLRFTATELLEVLKCPRRYAFLSEHSIPEDIGEEELIPRESAERHAWTQAGTLAHELLEQMDGPEPPSTKDLADTSAHRKSGRFLEEDIREEVLHRVGSGYRVVYDQYLENADVIRKEHSFAFRMNAADHLQSMIEGTIDLYAEHGDQQLILDYKYAHRRPEKIRDDRLQLLLYALPHLLSEDSNPQSLTCALFYLREDPGDALYELSPDRDELEQFRERTENAIQTVADMENQLPMEWEGEETQQPCEDRRCGFIPFCWNEST